MTEYIDFEYFRYKLVLYVDRYTYLDYNKYTATHVKAMCSIFDVYTVFVIDSIKHLYFFCMDSSKIML